MVGDYSNQIFILFMTRSNPKVFRFFKDDMSAWTCSPPGSSIQANTILMLVELSLKSPCLWSLVWPYNPCFILNLLKWVKLGIISEDSQGFYISTKLNLMKNVGSSEGLCKSKTRGETPVRTNLGEKTSLILSCFSSVLISSWLLILSPVLEELMPSIPCFGYFTPNSSMWRPIASWCRLIDG
jgi:hypothetical protein